jgi:CrcB protein
LQSILLISLGAILGANVRYGVAQYTARIVPSGFPYGTLLVNLSSSFVIGFFLIWSTERVPLDPSRRTFIAVGFCGSYSTYSAYAFETLALFEKGQWAAAAANVLFMNVLCLLAVVAGAALARGMR